MHEFQRILWSSEYARTVWEPKIQRIVSAWQKIEREREYCLQMLGPEQMPELVNSGKPITILGMQGLSTNASAPYVPGQPFTYRVLIGPTLPPNINYDDNEMGITLGYPKCCIRFFNDTWKKGDRDTIVQMSNGVNQYENVKGTNILLRWLGLRMVSHLPCSFSCEGTLRIAEKNEENARKLGFDIEWGWLKAILSWPIHYSTLHGIAEVKTPIFKLIHSSDHYNEERTVSLKSDAYPIEGARGNVFPYRKGKFMRGFSSELHSANGFSDPTTMFEAHEVVRKVAHQGLNKSSSSIVDLGCGNGVLLSKIYDDFPHLQVSGIDTNQEALDVAQQLLPRGMFTCCDMFDTGTYLYPSDDFTMVLLMPGRLIERKETPFANALMHFARKVVCYAYGDWLEKYNHRLDLMIEAAGFDFLNDWTIKFDSGNHKFAQAILLERR